MIHPNEIQFVVDDILDVQNYKEIVKEIETFPLSKRIKCHEAVDIQIARQTPFRES